MTILLLDPLWLMWKNIQERRQKHQSAWILERCISGVRQHVSRRLPIALQSQSFSNQGSDEYVTCDMWHIYTTKSPSVCANIPIVIYMVSYTVVVFRLSSQEMAISGLNTTAALIPTYTIIIQSYWNVHCFFADRHLHDSTCIVCLIA